ncbi:MAG: site-specific integrase [Candidatus Rokubacteria bacterium]|nr:site-specific integrase [Candidatus Rokubacteria bacterium]
MAQAYNIWATARWLNRFLAERGRLSTEFDQLEEADWADHAAWLGRQRGDHGKPLSHDYRRCQFGWIAAAVRHAQLLSLPGSTNRTLDALHAVSQRVFRGGNLIAQRRVQQRALSREQYDELYAVLAEEWRRVQEGERSPTCRGDLHALGACWLAFHDGLRPEELNVLTIDDVRADPIHEKHKLHVHAPNKDPDMVPIDRESLTILNAIVDVGRDGRDALDTRLLFVRSCPRPAILTTESLNRAVRQMLQRHDGHHLPADLQLRDGRKSLGTHLARGVGNRERVRTIMRHAWASTTELYYRGRQELEAASGIAKAIAGEVSRLSSAYRYPGQGTGERADALEQVQRHPDRDVRLAAHCFDCPLLAVWASKRHNFVYERDEFQRRAVRAGEAEGERDFEHAALTDTYVTLIDRRLSQARSTDGHPGPLRRRRPRRRQR